MPATLRISWSRPSGCSSCTFEYGYKLHSDSTYITGATTNGTVQVITGLQNAATYDVRLRTVAPDLDGVTGPIRSRWIQSQVVTCDTPPPELNSPTQTPLPSATPLPNTNTPIPYTNTPLPNTNTPIPYTNTPVPTVDPSKYYYAMGDCTDMKYTGYTSTITGFGAPIVVPVCMNYQEIADFYATNNFGLTNLVIDDNAPCGFGSGYTPPKIAQSSTQYANETVFDVDGNCWSVIEANPSYVSSWTIDLDNYTPYQGANPCYACANASFTGFTYYQYSATKCSDGSPTYTYSIFPYVEGGSIFNYVNGQVYYLANHDINGNITEQFCATITGYIGEYSGPSWYDGYTHWPVGPLTCGGPYTSCSDSECITGRTDCLDINTGGGGSSTPTPTPTPTIDSGNVSSITTSIYNTVTNNATCGYDDSPYNTYNYDTIFTFRDSGGNPVTPNKTVTYSADNITYQTLSVTSSTVHLTLYDTSAQNNCQGENGFGSLDVVYIKVGGRLVLTYTAGT